MRNAIAPSAQAVVAAAFLLSGAPAPAKDGGSGIEPVFEIEGAAGKEERGAVAYLELDGALPVYTGSGGRSVLFVQPGAIFSQEFGGRSLYGASVGMAYRFRTAAGIAGLNAFYDMNWLQGSGPARRHAQGSVGADFQTGRSLIGANWYFPLSGKATWESGRYRITEEAVGGAELRYRFALDDRWALKGRTYFEISPGGAGSSGSAGKRRVILAAGASYRFDCTRIGLDVEHDTGTRQTALLVSLAVQFGADGAQRSCAEVAGGSLTALVERSKIIATRQTVTARIVPFTMLPNDVTKLFVEVEGGDPNAEEVWLFSQGGPVDSLIDEDGNQPGVAFSQFPGHENRLLVNVHQAQTLNPDLFTDERLTTLERIQVEMDVSVEILHRVIRHFKAQGKKVVVFGHSFGAFTVTRYLAVKGPAAADRYVIMAGRLDMEQALVDNRLEYHGDRQSGLIIFQYDTSGAKEVALREDATPEREGDRRSQVFQGILARHRYTQLLANTDLSKVIYAYGTRDQRTGSLDQSEVDFLNARGAEVIAVEPIPGADPTDPDFNGGHGSMFTGTVPQQIVDLLD